MRPSFSLRYWKYSNNGMGKKNFRGRKGRGGNRDAQEKQTGGWDAIVMENEKWENYYRSQNLMTDEEFTLLKQHFQKPLPLTFRITGSKEHANEIKKIFKERHLQHLGDIEHEGEQIQAPKPLPFYPDELAWQVDISKQAIRRNERFAKTQRFLVIETEVGNISRQEAVSMIPPLVLDVQPHHKVLDMCAAPGSKTAQIIESLHQQPNPTGIVIANDADYKRAQMLVHQIKRLNSPNMIVVNHQAQFFPKTKVQDDFVKFDRILCDVPCSGDGTMRKNVQIWKKWGVGDGIGLNPLQFQILQRGIELLAKGGRLVYSTCSMNPIENESVVLQALRRNKDIRIVKTELPGLVYSKGLKNWKVIGKDYEEKPRGSDPNYGDEFYPPTEEEEDFNLDDCIRVYPQQQNTGGFFITVLEKLNETGTVEQSNKRVKKTETTPAPKKERLSTTASDISEPFNFLPPDNEELVKCWNFYGFNKEDEELTNCCFVRNATGEPSRNIYLSSPQTKEYLIENEERLKIVHSGVKLFVSQRTDLQCKWRIQNEALPMISNRLTDARVLKCSLSLFEKLLKEAFPRYEELDSLDKEFSERIKGLPQGCAFIRIENHGGEELLYPIWVGTKCINLMVSKKETYEVLYRVFNIETNAQQEYKQKPTGPGKPIGGPEGSEESAEEKKEDETVEEAETEIPIAELA